MITYEIKENNEDIKKAVIVKKGHEIEFTLERVEYNEQELLKSKREVDATLKHHQLIVDNVKEHNPFVLELTDEQRHAVHMYYESDSIIKRCVEKQNEIGTMMLESSLEVAEIKKQLGIEEPAIETEEDRTDADIEADQIVEGIEEAENENDK